MVDLFDRSSSLAYKEPWEIRQEKREKKRADKRTLKEQKKNELSSEEIIQKDDRPFLEKTGDYIVEEIKNIYNNSPESLLNKPVIRLLRGQGVISVEEALDPDYKLTEFQKTVASGAGRSLYTLADIAATGIDIVVPLASNKIASLLESVADKKTADKFRLETNLNEKIDQLYLEAKPEDPETFFGQVGSLLIEYGLPTTWGLKVVNGLIKLPKFVAGTKLGQKIYKPKAQPWGAKPKKPPTQITKIAKAVGLGSAGFAAGEFLAGSREGLDPFDKIPIPDFITKYTGLEDIELDKLENLEGLTGRDLAIAKFKNRLLYMKQGGALGALFPIVGKGLKVAGKLSMAGTQKVGGGTLTLGSKLLAKVGEIPGAGNVAREVQFFGGVGVDIIREPIHKVLKIYANRGTGDVFKTLPKFEKWRKFDISSSDPVLRRLKKLDTYSGLQLLRSAGKFTTEEILSRSKTERFVKSENKKVTKYLDSIEKKIYELAKSFGKDYDTKLTTPAYQEQQLEHVLEFVKGQKTIKELPEVLRESAAGLEKAITTIKKRYAGLLPDGELKNFMQQDIRSYMKKSFSLFTSKNYAPDPVIYEKATQWVTKNVIKANKDLKEDAFKVYGKFLSEEESYIKAAKDHLESILNRGNYEGKDVLANINYIANSLRIDTFMKTGEELPKVIKNFLGEEKGKLRENVLFTTTEMIVQTAQKKMYDELGQIGLKEGWLFETESMAKYNQVNPHGIGELHGLSKVNDSLTSKTSKYYASQEVAEMFREGKTLFSDRIKGGIYAALLSGQAATQYGLTVLSPATQVRNVLSASMFALFNGHFGGRASIINSFEMVVDDIFGAGKTIDEADFIERISRKVELGVMDENIVASELKGIVQDLKNRKITDTQTLVEILSKTKFLSKATELYGGGDNLWKFFGHEFVMSQLKPAMRNFDDVIKYHKEIMGVEFNPKNIYTNTDKTVNEAIEEMAAWSIRNTYPTYSMVPPVIQALRRFPLGNFVAFPAEMWRTSYNALEIAMKEISSSDPIIREMGFRRLMGGVAVHGGFGIVAPAVASSLTGITQEFIENYKRDFGASWEKDSALVPITQMGKGSKKGIFKYVNLSYFNPYAMVAAPFKKMYKFAFDSNNRYTPEDQKETLLGSLFNPEDGAISGLFKPFLSQAIFFEKTVDLLPPGMLGRGGVTKTGTRLWGDKATWGEISTKATEHFIKGIIPGALRTASRIDKGFEGNKYIDPYAELVNLFSGIKYQEVNIADRMSYLVYDYNNISQETKVGMDMYKDSTWASQTPEGIITEYYQQQMKALGGQLKIYQTLDTLKQAGFTDSEIRNMLAKTETGKTRISSIKVNSLLKGEFYPVPVAEGRMEGKIKALKKLEKQRSNLGVNVFTTLKNEDYYYPKKRLKDMEKYLKKNFKLTTYEKLRQSDVNKDPSLQEEFDYQKKQEEDRKQNLKENREQEREDRKKEREDRRENRAEIQTPPLPLPGNPEEITTVAQSTIPVANQGGLGITNKARINEFGDIVKNTTV